MLSTFIRLPFVIKIFDLSISEWLFYTGFTVFPRPTFLLTICLESVSGYSHSLMRHPN